ncbi:MAG: response regulator [Gemmatimonadetes bacterium]|jgi:signal transduction histidine kinase/DNA-binding response OmpR family regulator/HPt (histidine-containing phosphotransfer) domain-containing protein/streptogramin lyase|nr:response regulator [Gemmatimonadota bacterium]MBT7863688.1 response regulator [Gemmatimonadota bacterium]
MGLLRRLHVPIMAGVMLLTMASADASSRVAMAIPTEGITVDGSFEDWPESAPAYPLQRLTAGDQPVDRADLTGSFRLAWDQAGRLYVAIELIDDERIVDQAGGDWRSQDGLELFLQPSADDETTISQIALWGDRLVGGDEGVQVRTQVTAHRRQIEWCIEPDRLGAGIGAGTLLGFDVAVNDRDTDSFTTSMWGEAQASGSGLGQALLLPSATGTAILAGTVLRADSPIPRATVQIQSVQTPAWIWVLQADRQGRFSLRVPQGTYEVQASAVPSSHPVSVQLAKGGADIDVVLPATSPDRRRLGAGTTIPAGEGTPVEASFGIQQGLWRTYGLPDGLGSTIIDAIYQDSDGYLWFGTQGGVSRYEGANFTTYTITEGLAYNGVSAIAEDASGVLWFGTWGGGLSRYDGETFTTFTTADGLADDVVLALHRDRTGHLWIGTQSGLNCLDGDELLTYGTAHGLPHSQVGAIAETADGVLWFGTWGGGVSRFDGETFTTFTSADGLAHDEISDIAPSADGSLWFATQGGVGRYVEGRFERFTEADGLAHNGASSLAFDELGDLWVGTWEGGVSRFDGSNFTTFTTAEGLAHDEVSVLATDADGHLWLGTWGGGISRYDGANFAHFGEEGLNGAGRALLEDRQDYLWVGTDKGLFRQTAAGIVHYTTASGLVHDAINAIAEDADGVIWIGTQAGLNRFDGEQFTTFTTDDGLPHDWVNDVLVDSEGDLWLGTWGGGASHYDGKHFTTYDATSGLGHDWVNTIYEDGFQRLWFGTKGGGVARLDAGEFFRLTSDDGLAANWVWSIIESDDGAMWFATDNGVNRYANDELSSLTARDGLSSDHVTALLQDDRGRFWFGTDGGGITLHDGAVFQDVLVRDGLQDNVVTALLQDRASRVWIASSQGLTLHRPRVAPPRIHLVDVVADRRYGAVDQLEISAAQDYLAVEFEGVSLKTRPGALLYRYRLEGFDETSLLTGVPRVEYVDLPLGDYTFVVEAIDRDLTPSAVPVRVAVRVHPPYGDIVLYASLVIVLMGLAWAAGQIMQRNRRLQVARDELAVSLDSAEDARAEADAARLEADAANDAKSTFLAKMSHEIRTPMNGIVGMVDMLRRTRLEKNQINYLSVVDTSADALLELINDILDLSKIEAGSMELEKTDFVLWEVLEGVMKLMAMRAHEKGLELACHVAPDVPEGIVGDPTRLRQIIVNLIGNGIKFTAEGEVVVQVQVTSRSDDAIELHFGVRDTGIGIPQDKQALVFEAFSQADSSTTRQFGGTGLGLNISRQLSELMGGGIWLESEEGVGSTFQFNAHFGVSDMRTAEMAPEPWKKLNQSRILAVEENATNRLIIEQMLNGWGLETTTFASGEEALAEMRRAHAAGTPYSLAMLDAHAAPMDGLAIARELRRQPDLVEHVMMVLTSLDGQDDIDRYQGVGVAHTMRKPITQSDLLDAILSSLGPAVGLQGRSSTAEAEERMPPLAILLADDNETNRYVATSMLEEQGHRVVTAEDGVVVLEALDEAPFDLILMDVQMPKMDGYEATGEIRRRETETGGHIPIIGLTANAMKGDREACLEAGMDEYVPKPVRWAALRDAIVTLEVTGGVIDPNEVVIPSTSELENQDVETPAIETSNVDESILDPTALQSLQKMEGRGAISVDRMFALFVDNGERILPVLREALEGPDAARLQLEAHSLKGSAGYLGARRLAALCQEVEDLGKADSLEGVADLLDDIESAFEEARQALRQILPDAETTSLTVTTDAPADWDLDELESSARQQLPEVLEFLTAQEDRWSRLSETMDITDTEEFGEDIRQVGATHNCPPLQRWGETLATCSRNFDITSVQTMINQFEDVIERVRVWAESGTAT